MVPEKKDIQEYDYAIEVVYDKKNGGADLDGILEVMQSRAKKGWRYVNSITNELGKNVMSYGGVGTNATIDQTILFFEKRVRNLELEALEQLNKEKRTEIDINECNMVSPFYPTVLTLISKGSEMAISVSVKGEIGYNIRGLRADVIVHNVFGEEYLLNDVCFFNFNSTRFASLFESDSFPVQMPDRISRGVEWAGLIVKQYIDEEGLHAPENNELGNVKQERIKNSGGFDKNEIMEKLDKLHSAGEVMLQVRSLSDNMPGIFDDEIIQSLFKLYSVERSTHANLKDDAIKQVNEYLGKK